MFQKLGLQEKLGQLLVGTLLATGLALLKKFVPDAELPAPGDVMGLTGVVIGGHTLTNVAAIIKGVEAPKVVEKLGPFFSSVEASKKALDNARQ